MNKETLEAFAREAAKGIKTEQDLNEFRQMLTKVTVEHALNRGAGSGLAFCLRAQNKTALEQGRGVRSCLLP